MEDSKRIVWIDWLKVIACFMVMVVHSVEPFYLGGNGSLIESESDAWWVSFFDSFVRSCVPLFVIASSFLLFPLQYPAGTFLKKRAAKILIPFTVWSVFYAIYWGEPVSNLRDLLFNFNYAAGHLWFVYMLVGLYLLMPMLSPWAQNVGKKELSVYIAIWLLSTLVPFVREALSDEPLAITYGPTGIPRQALLPLWGEACWNAYGTFYYISGFLGYMLVGLWLRKFGTNLPLKKTLPVAVSCLVGGFFICFCGFLKRVFSMADGNFPVGNCVADAVWWETTWCNDTFGVAVMTIGSILLIMRISSCGKFYEYVIAPVAKASYGIYLGHMVALAFYSGLFRSLIHTAPLVILATAIASFITVSVVAIAVRKIPVIGKFIIG